MNQAVVRACDAQIVSISAWTHHDTRYGNTSTNTEWAQSEGLHAADAEATTPCQICYPGQMFICLSCEEEATVYVALPLPTPERLNAWDL